jgi:hypothetical protein
MHRIADTFATTVISTIIASTLMLPPVIIADKIDFLSIIIISTIIVSILMLIPVGTLMLIPKCTTEAYIIKNNNKINNAYITSFFVGMIALSCTQLFFEKTPFYGTHDDRVRNTLKILFCSLGRTVLGTAIGYGIPKLFNKESLGFLFGCAIVGGYCCFVKTSGYKIFNLSYSFFL